MSGTVNASQWQWDVQRGDFFYWSASERCWIYQNGGRVYADNDGNSQQQATDPAMPRSVPAIDADNMNEIVDRGSTGFVRAEAYAANQGAYSTTNNSAYVATGNPHTWQVQYQQSQQNQYHDSGQNSHAYTSGGQEYNTPYTSPQGEITGPQPTAYQSYNQGKANAPAITQPVQYFHNAETITDRALYRSGITSHHKVSGTPGETEPFDSRYRVRPRGHEFFTFGRVFKVLWPLLAGDNAPPGGSLFSDPKYNQGVYVKIMWFVVIRPGEDRSCSCLPIQTYSGRGVAKPGTIKHHHAMIWSNEEPEPKEDELPNEGERPMLAPVRVVPRSKTEALDPMSRVNFVKLCTIEHNVKVYDFGVVHKESERVLLRNFHRCWNLQ